MERMQRSAHTLDIRSAKQKQNKLNTLEYDDEVLLYLHENTQRTRNVKLYKPQPTNEQNRRNDSKMKCPHSSLVASNLAASSGCVVKNFMCEKCMLEVGIKDMNLLWRFRHSEM
jgi:hypothetical protein